ncbi:2OG-Fe(II) oxygenase superfamily protein [Cognatiyoonia koreensis]|uniref:2OG-Fe(II) oxygenase superfamily protein n=1 Tax=Cognatiyoonia koreensis TaxID=364200 RepID=A0A1I0RT32_9RHOB|nr:2OG-Fe(II) oxygenase [Cognatiyoonia koreensis]SEW44450.1 2OG-Fe(II) oxygenase superfamily protein [Cognatiyoonia koreensis]
MNQASTALAATDKTEAVYALDLESLYISPDQAATIGKRYSQQYQSGKPYHYIGIDDFLPLAIAEKVREEAMQIDAKPPEHSSAQEHLKASYNPDILPAYSRLVFNALNSHSFIRFLEEMTGIDGLIPDPYFKGGGIHRTSNGGYLGIHADFNHHKQMNLERRLNVLIYLNPDWKEEYGGSFEIWTDDMGKKIASFPPIMNRMCCFSTSSTSMHGNPDPINHPDGQPRISIALYYYTATWSDSKVAHSTLFRVRPGTGDKETKGQDRLRIMRKYTPPVLHGTGEKVLRKLKLV